MENFCCKCLQGNGKELVYFSFCSHWLCDKCFREMFKVNVLISCPKCQVYLKISDFYLKNPSKEMPMCMNLDSDFNIDALPGEFKELLLNASGFDWNEIERSCQEELIEGLDFFQFSGNGMRYP